MVVTRAELLLEPVDHVLEGVVILVMEEVASRFDLDELLDHLFLWDVAKNYVLRVLVEDGKPVRDPGVVFSLLLLDSQFKLIIALALQELRMIGDFPQGPVARSEIPLDNLLKILISLI